MVHPSVIQKRFFNCIGYEMSNVKMTVACELERIWNEAIVAYFKVLSKNSP